MNTTYTERSLTAEERETVITCYRDNDGNYIWTAETSIQPHMTKLKNAGWEQTGQTIAKSTGSVQEMRFTCKRKNPLSFRDITKEPRKLTDEERAKAAERMKERVFRAKPHDKQGVQGHSLSVI